MNGAISYPIFCSLWYMSAILVQEEKQARQMLNHKCSDQTGWANKQPDPEGPNQVQITNNGFKSSNWKYTDRRSLLERTADTEKPVQRQRQKVGHSCADLLELLPSWDDLTAFTCNRTLRIDRFFQNLSPVLLQKDAACRNITFTKPNIHFSFKECERLSGAHTRVDVQRLILVHALTSLV